MKKVTSVILLKGEVREMPHMTIADAKRWNGYMQEFYDAKPIRIIDEQGNVLEKNICEKW